MRGELSSRRAREIEGRKAEAHVARWLKLRGWKILDERFKVAEGEVDIIARRKDIIAFVEVKQRETLPVIEDIITHTNAARVMAAAETWVERNFEGLGTDFGIRFDLALIEGAVKPLSRVKYIESAFSGF